MILSARKIKALAKIASPDNLRAQLTGVYIDLKTGMAEACNSIIAVRTKAQTDFDDEEYPSTAPIEHIEHGAVNISPKIFKIAKTAEKNQGIPILDETLMLSHFDEDNCLITTNKDDKSVIRYLPKYPPVDEVIWSKLAKESDTIAQVYSLANLLKILTSLKEIGCDTVTQNVSIVNQFSKFTGRSYTDNTVSAEAVIMNGTDPNISSEIKKSFAFEYEYTDGNATGIYKSEKEYDSNEACKSAFLSEIKESIPPHSLCMVRYKIKKIFRLVQTQPEYVYFKEEDFIVKQKEEEALTPEESNAANELTDGPGSSDSADVQIAACQAADESIDKEVDQFDQTDKEVTDPNPEFTAALTEGTAKEEHSAIFKLIMIDEKFPKTISEEVGNEIIDSFKKDSKFEHLDKGWMWYDTEDEENIKAVLTTLNWSFPGATAVIVRFNPHDSDDFDDIDVAYVSKGEGFELIQEGKQEAAPELTEDEIEERVLCLYDANYFPAEISVEFGMTIEDVNAILKKNGRINNERINKVYDTWNKIHDKHTDYCVLLYDSGRYYAFHSAEEYLNRLRDQRITFTQFDKDISYASFDKSLISEIVQTLVSQGLKVCQADDIGGVEYKEPSKYPNHMKKWTREDEEKLEFLWKAGKSIEDLSEIFGRKPDGIEKRLEKMQLIEHSSEKEPTESAIQEPKAKTPFFSESGYVPPVKQESKNIFPEGYKNFVEESNVHLIKKGTVVILKSEEEAGKFTMTDSIKLTLKTFPIWNQTVTVSGTYHPTGFTHEKLPYYILPYSFIKYYKDKE